MARLPPELMLLIFKGSDKRTLINLCIATVGSASHYAAVQECWNEVEINVEDLIPAPEEIDEDVEFVQQYKANLDPNSKLNQAVKYASYIRKLDFNLSVDDIPEELIPTYETSVHSAKLLLPVAVNMEVLSIDGPACEEVYNSVKEIPRLRSLFIGRRKATIRMRDSNKFVFEECWPAEKAEWTLPMLEEYENHQFWRSYAHQYLLTSEKLQRVYISVVETNLPRNGRENRGPLYDFVSSWDLHFKDSPSKELLKSLSIVDHWFQGSNTMFPNPAEKQSCVVTGVRLEDLYVQSSLLSQSASLLSRYPDSKPRSLRVSSIGYIPEVHDRHGIQPHNAIRTLVDRYKEDLQEVVLSHAWHAGRLFPNLEASWKGQFTFTDLTLSTPSPDFYDTCYVVGSLLIKRPLSLCLWGPHRSEYRWGTQLQRIRLGDVSVSIGEIDCLDRPELSMLRILILCPNLDHCRSYELSHIRNNFNTVQLAHSIAAKAPASLRYLAIGSQVYWLTSGKIMDYEHARIVEPEIQSWMTPDDLEFINPQSRWNKLCQPIKWDSCILPRRDEVAEQNFIIARPVRNQDDKE